MEDYLELEIIKEGDIEECVELFIDTFSNEPWNDIYESKEEVYEFFSNHINNNYFIGYIVRNNGNIAGISLGFKKPWIKGMEYYIDQFCIGYSMQGKGIGSKFMNLIEEDIKKKSMNAIILNTERGYPSEKFYKKNGFDELEGYIILAK